MPSPSDAEQLRAAAAGLVQAAEMLEHNDAIFKGPWKKGAKAWSGEFIERTVRDAVAKIAPALRAAPPTTAAPVSATQQSDTAKLYEELLYQVSKKHPGESRHQTALRYIQQAENSGDNCAGSDRTASKEGEDA